MSWRLTRIIGTKEALYRFVFKVGDELTSTAVKGDAWHHRSEAITSAAAFVGISIALIGGKSYESADDWAALLACGIIVFNGQRIFRAALSEIMDAAVPGQQQSEIRRISSMVPGVVRIEKCRIRKSGLGLFAHEVSTCLKSSPLGVQDVTVHIELALTPAEIPARMVNKVGG